MAIFNTYILAGGGTGGHLYPAVAIAQRIQELRPNSQIRFIGTARGLENRIIPELGFPLSLISVRGVVRSLTFKNVLVPFVLLWSVLHCFALLKKYRPKAVIGTGGYVSGPVLFTAGLLRIPTLIQEQNSYPGATTRLLARIVNRVHISFDESRRYFKTRQKLFLTGNPVRPFDLSIKKEDACASFGLNAKDPVCLVFGGSQGASAMNNALLDVIDELMETSSIQFIWSTGQYGIEKVKENVAKYSDRIRVSAFISDMATAYAAADFGLTRAGALTLAELTLAGMPAILVPYPYAAANHQETNARALEEQRACIVILEKDLQKDLKTELLLLASDTDRRKALGEAARKNSFPLATQKIVESVFEIER